MINKTCKQCQKEFVVTDDDLAFYKKISPNFAGKTFEIPPPTLCPECREIRRLVWRNERSLYKRKSDKSGKEIISMFSPDKQDIKIYSADEWWSDDWDAMDYGRDFNFEKSFFKQFRELLNDVPQNALSGMNNENCEYANYIQDCKDCYMSVVCYYETEKTHYSWGAYYAKNCVDIFLCDHVENCYALIMSNGCYNCNYSIRLNNCRDCHFSIDLTGCSDCLFCSNLNRKSYCIKNIQYTKEEYEQKIKEYNFGSYKNVQEYWQEFENLRANSIVKFANIVNCENCEGDDLVKCKNIRNSFSQIECEDVRFSLRGRGNKNAQDLMGGDVEWGYEDVNVGFGSNYFFSYNIEHSSFMYYCASCFYSSNCFGCVGLRNKQYCIFNKQYTRDEYELLVGKIIEKMIKDNEWGEFFPMNIVRFAYNESLVNDFFPKKKEQALALGATWQDNYYGIKTDGPFYEPKDDILDYLQSDQERERLLSGILKCAVSGRPFKIVPQELAFYLQYKIPIPRKHYDVRFKENFSIMNPRKLYHRKCMNEGCNNEFETTYAPDRPEKVYCEKCYQQAII